MKNSLFRRIVNLNNKLNSRDADELDEVWNVDNELKPFAKHYDPKYGEEVSVRVTEKEGTYEVNTNRSIRRFASLKDMPMYMQKAIAVLSISEPEYYLKGVGRRLHGGRFWLYASARKTMKGETDENTQ